MLILRLYRFQDRDGAAVAIAANTRPRSPLTVVGTRMDGINGNMDMYGSLKMMGMQVGVTDGTVTVIRIIGMIVISMACGRQFDMAIGSAL